MDGVEAVHRGEPIANASSRPSQQVVHGGRLWSVATDLTVNYMTGVVLFALGGVAVVHHERVLAYVIMGASPLVLWSGVFLKHCYGEPY